MNYVISQDSFQKELASSRISYHNCLAMNKSDILKNRSNSDITIEFKPSKNSKSKQKPQRFKICRSWGKTAYIVKLVGKHEIKIDFFPFYSSANKWIFSKWFELERNGHEWECRKITP